MRKIIKTSLDDIYVIILYSANIRKDRVWYDDATIHYDKRLIELKNNSIKIVEKIPDYFEISAENGKISIDNLGIEFIMSDNRFKTITKKIFNG